jgi:hypothetical protein
MQIWSTNSGWFQVFRYEKSQFINWQSSKVLEVKDGKDEEGHAVGVNGNTGSRQQQWQVIYVDKSKGPQTKGLNKEWGFYVNRPFYLQSKLPFGRMAECIGANNVTMRRWRVNTKAMQWYFDGVSKTIKNNNWKSHSLDIQSNGGSTNVRCTTTNSRWW